jgi:beta-xylosidase
VLCIGVATSKVITGPYLDSGKPLVRNATVGYIDATAYFNDKELAWYLIWKEDGNGHVPQIPTPIWAARLSDDGLRVDAGQKTELIRNTLPWEGALVEGPWVIRRGAYYYLFYSANAYYNGSVL